ncbi:MAG: hypothetical protein AAF633_16925 [Chloroflexota bacterium]
MIKEVFKSISFAARSLCMSAICLAVAIILASCNQSNLEQDKQLIITQGLRDNTAQLIFKKDISDISPYPGIDIELAIYEISLDDGSPERRSLATIDNEIFYLGPMENKLNDLDAELSFVRIGRLQFIGLHLNDPLNGNIESIALYRDNKGTNIVSSVGTVLRSPSSAVIPLSVADEDLPWTEFTHLDVEFISTQEKLGIDYDPPLDITDFFVDVPYVEPTE